MTPEVKQRIDNLVNNNKIVIFMKGSKLMPQCGFSNNVVQILNSLGAPYETIDVLDDPEIRQGIKEYSKWPTIPQIYINGESAVRILRSNFIKVANSNKWLKLL